MLPCRVDDVTASVVLTVDVPGSVVDIIESVDEKLTEGATVVATVVVTSAPVDAVPTSDVDVDSVNITVVMTVVVSSCVEVIAVESGSVVEDT